MIVCALLCALICALCVHYSQASRIKRAFVHPVGCSIPSHLRCSAVQEFLKAKHKEGLCLPNDPRWIRCNLDTMTPTTEAWREWTFGQDCADYYQAKTCMFTNFEYSTAEGRLTEEARTNSGPCREPQLLLNDCEEFRAPLEALNMRYQSHRVSSSSLTPSSTLGMAADLAKGLADLRKKGPDEWFWMPTVRPTIFLLSSLLDEGLISSSAKTERLGGNKEVEPVWKALLMYCIAAKTRAIEIDKKNAKPLEEHARKVGQKECYADTHLDNHKYEHPWRGALAASARDFDGAGLKGLSELGVLDLDEELWQELAILTEGDWKAPVKEGRARIDDAFKKLVRTAGDRSEAELELALAMTAPGTCDGAYCALARVFKPEGGERRLLEMRTTRILHNAVSAFDSTQPQVSYPFLEEAVAAAKELLEEEDNLLWVDPNAFHKSLDDAEKLLEIASEMVPLDGLDSNEPSPRQKVANEQPAVQQEHAGRAASEKTAAEEQAEQLEKKTSAGGQAERTAPMKTSVEEQAGQREEEIDSEKKAELDAAEEKAIEEQARQPEEKEDVEEEADPAAAENAVAEDTEQHEEKTNYEQEAELAAAEKIDVEAPSSAAMKQKAEEPGSSKAAEVLRRPLAPRTSRIQASMVIPRNIVQQMKQRFSQ